jgi:hypothetical protein
MSDILPSGIEGVPVRGLVTVAIIQTVQKVVLTVMPVAPLAFVLVQAKTFVVVPLGNEQLFEVWNAVKLPTVQCVRLHPVQESI